MTPSLRILRAQADEIAPPPCRTRRQSARHDRILAVAEGLIAQYGCRGITFRALAIALRMAPTTLRFHYVDLDALCGDILRIHLRKIADAIGNVPRGAENRRQLQRAAYLAATRSASSSLTNAHLILTRDRAFLPSDELDSIENIRRVLGESLVEPGNPDILPVLDTPWIGPDQIEAALTLLAPAIGKPAAAAKPESPPLTAVEPAEPPARPFIRFNIQDIPLPLPGSLAAMTDEELDAADNEAAAPPPNVLISPGPKHSPAEASAP